MRVFSSNILFLSKYLASIACSNVTVAMLFRNFARAMLMFSRDICVPKRRHKCHARTSASRERNFETEHCCKLWKQDIYLEIRYLRKIPAFLGRILNQKDVTNVTREHQHRASEISKQNIAASYGNKIFT